ncbi:NAD(P)-dependent oxidoreductase [Streptomyces sp. NRRL B-3229]|uniref:NAD(P)-dependent oxidoreductase n=1 Tax=Streptomyces sp. NRRL B-3229 TaxID=1463836 RepID=UPI00099DC734|nr:NAD(P)-binding domain-containing protein [Streptomyces sp. NRRL B-3229]
MTGNDRARLNPGTTVGFVGAGRIGEPMVERLLTAGHHVRLYARRADIGARLSAAGAELVDTVAGIAASDVVVSCLYSDAQIIDVLPEAVAAMDPRTVLVSHTTGTPETLTRLDPRHAAVVDAPFSGTPETVRAGCLVVYAGGEPEHVATARRVMAAYADPVIATGPPGSALHVKLLNNLLFAAVSQVTLAGLEAGRKLGIEESALLEALAVGSGGSTAGRHIAARGGSEAFAAAVTPYLRKDLSACTSLAGVDWSALLATAHNGPLRLTEQPPPGTERLDEDHH